LGKIQVSYRIDKTLDKSLYKEDNPHISNRFYNNELDPKFQQNLFHNTFSVSYSTPISYLFVRGICYAITYWWKWTFWNQI